MNITRSFVVVGVCGLLAASASADNTAAPAAPARPLETPSASTAAPTSPGRPTTTATASETKASEPTQAPSPSPALEANQAAEEAKRAHIRPATEPLMMDTPPPPAPADVKPPRPDASYVWVPGHWSPVQGEWKWQAGEWAVPATPASVWIDPKYDPKTKQWSAGYWQPDRPQSYDAEVAPTDAPKPVKF